MYTVGQLAQIIGVHRNTVQNWCRSGRIPAMKTPGGHYRITEAALAALVCKPAPAAQAA